MINKALVIVAHGSRKETSNKEVMALGKQVESLLGEHYTYVMTAFLEFTSPSLEESILSCIKRDAKEIVILPYFLALGNHVTRDIPEIVAKIQASYPNIKMILKGHIGSTSGIAALLVDMAVNSDESL